MDETTKKRLAANFERVGAGLEPHATNAAFRAAAHRGKLLVGSAVAAGAVVYEGIRHLV